MHFLSSILFLVPHLMISSLARESSAGWAGQPVRVGDERLEIVLEASRQELAETQCTVLGEPIPGFRGIPWSIRVGGQQITPKEATLAVDGDRPKTSSGPAFRGAVFSGEEALFRWNLEYRVTGPGRITKFLRIMPKEDFVLEQVEMWHGQAQNRPSISGTGLSQIAAFYHEKNGMYASLDFPYSRIHFSDGITTISYPPQELLKAGQLYEAHSLTMGAFQITGKQRYGSDTGLVDAMDSYIQERFQPRFERPMFLSSCIINRYTYVQRNVIWYTYKDHPTLSFNIDLLKRDIDLMGKLGVEYYQLFPGYFDWGPDDPKPKLVHEIMDFAHDRNMRAGDYSVPNGLFCGHYNDYSKKLDRPEWLLHEKENKPFPGVFCLGNPDYVTYYSELVAANCKKFGFEEHCLDFLRIMPCYAENHGHPVGEESVYHQVKGLVRILEALNAVSPQMMTWSNSGVWQGLLPKLAWYNPNIYLTDPGIMTPWQGLNMTRLLDDARREQMVSLHYGQFLPYRFFSNYQYFLSQNSVVPDIRNYQYGVLSTIAVTPNLSIGEIRPWLDKLPAQQQEEVVAFYKKWTDFLKKNFDLWKKTYSVGDNPGFGSVEIYAHTERDRGFIFIVNPQYWDRVVELPLNEEMGFAGDALCEVAELYPTERLCLTSRGPFVRLGEKLIVQAPAQQVRVFEIRPAPAKIKEPRLYGLPGSIEKAKKGYLLKTSGQQGNSERFAVLLPDGKEEITSASVRADIPKQPQRDFYKTSLEYLGTNKQGALFQMKFRRALPPTELREWRAEPGDLDTGLASKWNSALPDGPSTRFPLFINASETTIALPFDSNRLRNSGLGPMANFSGAYVDNAFGEMQETWIDLETNGQPQELAIPLAQNLTMEASAPLNQLAGSKEKQWWVQSRFHLPYIYMMGMEPAFDEHTILVLPFVDPSKVKKIDAWINGEQLEIQRYRYPRNRGLFCFWADLVGSGARSGDNSLVVHLEFQ